MIVLRFLLNIVIFLIQKLGYNLSIKKISSNISYEVIDKNLWYPFLESESNYYFNLYRDSIRKSGSYTSDSFEKKLRFYSLFNIVENILKNKEYKNFLEFGCWKGHSSYAVASIMKNNSFNKNFYIFDSFEGGLSERTIEDNIKNRYQQSKKEIINQKKYFESNYKEVKDLLSEFEFIKIYKGWIPDVFKHVEDKKFSFMHIDVDLFKPTYDSINYFYDSLEKGGIIVCDDYNCSDFPGARLAINEFFQNKKVQMFYEIPLGGCIIIK